MSKQAQKRPTFFGRYFWILATQFTINVDYVYFFLLGFLIDVAWVVPRHIWQFFVLIVVNTIAGVCSIAHTVGKVDKAFDTVGLNFNTGYGKPHWIVVGKYPADTDVYRLNSAGYGPDDFKPFLGQIASRLNQPIRDIRKSPNHSVLEVLLKKSEIPRVLKYEDLPLEDLKQGEFFIGQSDDGFEKLSLATMIHMLVAGQTGSGKTQCIKQIMATIMTRTRDSQIYLIDMKGGIDFQGFTEAPNFLMATTYPEAMVLIKDMVELFNFRKNYLIAKKKTNWTELSVKELARDKTFEDRPIGPVLIVVDELAELSKKASDAETSADLRKSLSTLAMLSRVTGIHLCLGTQYPAKTVISGDSKTNLPTRLCFAVPDVSASTIVVGDMSASTIGKNPGRAVFSSISTKIIQAPLLDNFALQKMVDDFVARGEFSGSIKKKKDKKEKAKTEIQDGDIK